MVNEARAYRERVLADLERRTKLARQHIEELAHGRERLLQVFERARLVAVDVSAELQAFTGPDEFVNFSPTTGPVPLLVPGAPLESAARPRADQAPDRTEAGDQTAAIDAVLDVQRPAAEVAMFDRVVDDADDTDTAAGDEPVDAPVAAAAVGAEEAEAEKTVAEKTVAEVVVTVEVLDELAVVDIVDDAESTRPPIAPRGDHNVVSLFPNRPSVEAVVLAELEGEPVAGPVGATDLEPARHDVDDIFARLRSEVPVGEPPADSETIAAGDDAAAPIASTPFTRRDEAIVPLIVTAARKLKRSLADEQNGVLDTLRRREPVTAIDAMLPSIDTHLALYADTMADELAAAAAAGASELGATDTKTLRRTLDKAGALDSARSLVRSDLVGPLRDRLERAIVDGGGDNEEITRRVRSVYREWKTQHIDDLLDDVFRFAFGGGIAVTAEPGTPMVWSIDPSEPACADCEDNSLAGEVASGESYPTGHDAAPAHPGCRCLTLPARQ